METEDGGTSYYVYPDLLSRHIQSQVKDSSRQESLLLTALWYQHHLNSHAIHSQVHLALSCLDTYKYIVSHNQSNPNNTVKCTLIYELVK